MADRKTAPVAVLYGGNSAEREISLLSGAAVAQGLTDAGYSVTLFDTASRDLEELKQLGIKRAFIALHGRGGEDGTIQGALEFQKVAYTGSRVLGSALGMDKVRCKQLWQQAGLPTAHYRSLKRDQFASQDLTELFGSFDGSVIVKPSLEGSSIGMAKANNVEELHDALVEAFRHDDCVLIEQWITGPEFTVAILGERALPSIRMQTPHVFYDYEAKYKSQSTEYYCPSGLSDSDEQHLQELALQAFNWVACEGWGRVDVMRDQASGQWFLLEVNTSPGMTTKSLVPQAAKQAGLSFDNLVSEILELAH